MTADTVRDDLPPVGAMRDAMTVWLETAAITLRALLTERDQLKAEVARWTETARQYALDAAHQRREREAADAECARLQEDAERWRDTAQPRKCSLCTALSRMQQERDQLAARVAELKAELEFERMRLAGCGVAARSDTQESLDRVMECAPQFQSDALAAVVESVRQVIQLRARVAELEGDLQMALESARQSGAAQDHMRHVGAEVRSRVAELEQEIDYLYTLKARVVELEEDRALCERTRTNMRRLLNEVAATLKGTPEPLHAHDWSGLPDMVARLREELLGREALIGNIRASLPIPTRNVRDIGNEAHDREITGTIDRLREDADRWRSARRLMCERRHEGSHELVVDLTGTGFDNAEEDAAMDALIDTALAPKEEKP